MDKLLKQHSINSFLQNHAQKFPHKEAIIAINPTTFDAEIITYQKLQTLIFQTVSFLISLGLKKGDRFAILMENTPEIIIFELAGALLGATTLPLDFKRDTMDRKIFKLQQTNSKLLLVRMGSSSDPDLEAIKEELKDLKIITWRSFSSFVGMLPNPIQSNLTSSVDSYFIILYTSGTTSHPKGVLLPIRACLLNALGIIDWQKLTEKDRFNIVLPLHHINSTAFYLATLIVGGTIILNSHYSASKFWQVVSKYKATITSIVPTILHDLLVRLEEFKTERVNISSLKKICIGSAPVLPEQTLKFYQAFKIKVIQGYGQTETALRVSGVPINLDEESYRLMVTSNSIGIPLRYNELAIMDGQNHRKKAAQQGEICIKGPVLADGYLNDPQATKMSFKKGWFHSGDLGYFKNLQIKLTSGEKKKLKFYFIVGRIKEIIIKGGVNISPSAIEDQLLKNFSQIEEVSVVGFFDERMGEEIAAAIVPKKGVDGQSLSDQIVSSGQTNAISGLSPYEVPKRVFVLDSLPKTSTGKIMRVEVKKVVNQLIQQDKSQKHLYVRRIDPKEREVLKKALQINNQRWKGLPAKLEEFTKRAKNGLLFGVFEEKIGLLGSLSCIQLNSKKVDKFKTWNQACSNGTFKNNDPHGDALVCVAISVKSSKEEDETDDKVDQGKLRKLANEKINWYVNSNLDHVLNFHRQAKFGLSGATVFKILENGREEDKESMGYNILMKYPKIDKNTKIIRSNAASPAILLIGQAMLYAQEKGIEQLIAFSRPAHFRKYLKEQLI